MERGNNVEPERVKAVQRLGLMDTPAEERFDRLCRLASQLLGTPVAYVSLLDDEKQFYKAAVGLGEMRETSLEASFCVHTVRNEETVYIPDATLDDRFKDNPFVLGPPNVRSYLGEPLFSPDGYAVGTFCVIDLEPRVFDPKLLQMCRDLADLAQQELNLVSQLRLQERLNAFTLGLSHQLELREVAEALLGVLQETVPSVFSAVRLEEAGRLKLEVRSGDGGEVGSELCVPIQSAGRLWGEMRLIRRVESLFSAQEAVLVEAFAAQAGLILEKQFGLAAAVEQSRLLSLGALAAGVAHELNSPLGAACMSVESLRRGLDKEKSRLIGRLDGLGQSIARAAEIVNDVLVFAGKGPVLEIHSNMEEAIRKTVSLLAHPMREAEIEMELRLEEDLVVALSPDELQRIVHHLLENARHSLESRPAHHRKIIVTASRESTGVLLSITDNGPGVPAEIESRLFDPFFTTREPGQGVGLGLSVSRRLARAAGGELEFCPGPEGALFQVVLPLVVTSAGGHPQSPN